MHEINDAIVQGGKIVLSQLPFADGQHVRIIVTETTTADQRLSIQEVRRILQGGVERDFCESDWSILDRLIRERALCTQRRVTSVRGQALDNGANMVSPEVAVGWLDEIGALQVSLAFLWLSVIGII